MLAQLAQLARSRRCPTYPYDLAAMPGRRQLNVRLSADDHESLNRWLDRQGVSAVVLIEHVIGRLDEIGPDDLEAMRETTRIRRRKSTPDEP